MIRIIKPEERSSYDQVVHHPLQSYAWGEFRQKTGLQVERLGFFDAGKLKRGIQISFHPIPLLGKTVGYAPKGFMPDTDQLAGIKQVATQHNALFVKLEPDVAQPVGSPSAHSNIIQFLIDHDCVPGRPLFTKYTFQIDLDKSETELFAGLESKTRYNVRLAIKKGVIIRENSTPEGLATHLEIAKETTKRQGFYAHSPEYFQTMWSTLSPTGMMKIFEAVYQNQVLVSWIMFVYGTTLYYPYGASRSINREVMASNLMLWEMIKYGQSQNLKVFDLWGCLGPKPNPKDPWFGFHKFKQGYGGQMMEYVGSFDLVLDPAVYKIFRIVESLRWIWLRARTKLGV